MQLEFFGTGAGMPGKFRNVASVALRLLDEINEIWLFDCGEGTQQQMLESTIKPRKIDKIFITHLHGDHIFGLPGLLSSRSFQGGHDAVTIYGPVGVKDFVQTSLRVSQTKLAYQINYKELTQPGMIYQGKKFTVMADRLDHQIECWGYRVIEHDHPGELLVDKLHAAGIPSGPLYGQLKQGKAVKLADGRTINGADFIGAPQKGRIVTILGDTRKTASIVTLAANADILVHESTFGKGESKLARNYYHSTNLQAAQTAAQTGVHQLLLTHISARYTSKMARELQKDARQCFSQTKVVRDFDVIDVPFPKRKEKQP
ncbi:Ribonuclease Z [Fructilactobacillus florum 8D]|uniref:Ribonuclease Z n=1 Tax=Fructilactobacillus florum 8D TaxID=1221538 RepID=W9ED37_9LACO|nr:ribonuclease Z [Fructilactobacillus florum]ETO40038.1 Ribonuclease Z [Fructilactobacillus florum 8D]